LLATLGTVVVELSPPCAVRPESGIGGGAEVRVIRRLVGVGLGVVSAHTVRVLAEDGREVCRRRCEPTVDSLSRVETAALTGTPVGTVLEVVMEPTGPAWLPVAVFFAARGHRVFRVSSAKAADLRRFLSRHAKSNGIDADTLARLPLVDPAGLHPLGARCGGGGVGPAGPGHGPVDRVGRPTQGADQGPDPAAAAVFPVER
jgi:hypothetical protein